MRQEPGRTTRPTAGASRAWGTDYERLGLITPPQRGDNGYRLYDERAVVELSFIANAQEVGFTLQQIKPSMAHLHAPPEQCQELIDGLQAKAAEIEARLAQDRTRLIRLNKMVKRLKGAAV